MFIFFLPLFVSVQVSDAYVKVQPITVFFSLNFSFFRYIFISKKFYTIKYVLLGIFYISCKSIW